MGPGAAGAQTDCKLKHHCSAVHKIWDNLCMTTQTLIKCCANLHQILQILNLLCGKIIGQLKEHCTGLKDGKDEQNIGYRMR